LTVVKCIGFSDAANDSCNIPSAVVLQLLPSEVLFHICSFLEAKFLLRSFSLVCKRFHSILSDVKFWKTRMRRRLQNIYPPVAGLFIFVICILDKHYANRYVLCAKNIFLHCKQQFLPYAYLPKG